MKYNKFSSFVKFVSFSGTSMHEIAEKINEYARDRVVFDYEVLARENSIEVLALVQD